MNTHQSMRLNSGKNAGTSQFKIKTPEYINMSFYNEFRNAYLGKKNYIKFM